MTDHDPDQDHALKELDLALRVAPSRAFADGVRARVSASRTNTTRVWWGLAAAASIGLMTMVMWRPSVEAPAKVAVAPIQVTAPAVPSKAPEGVVAVEKPLPSVTRRAATINRVTVATNAPEPQLEVLTNQGAVLRELWADYRGRPLVMAEGESVVEGLSTKPIAVDPIVVRQIVVSEIGKEPGTAGAAPIIRRADATRETR